MSDTLKKDRRRPIATSRHLRCRRRGHRHSLRRQPDAVRKGRAAGAPVEADVGGARLLRAKTTAEWRGRCGSCAARPRCWPGLEGHRAPAGRPRVGGAVLPDYAANRHRSINPEYLVVIGICTHLGCSPSEKFAPAPPAASARTGPAGSCARATVRSSTWPDACSSASRRPTNLEIPPHKWLSGSLVLIGEMGLDRLL